MTVSEALADRSFVPGFGEPAAEDGTPAQADVRALETDTRPFLPGTAGRDPASIRGNVVVDLRERLPSPKRHDVGVVEDGRCRVFVNVLCEVNGVDQRTEPVAGEEAGGGDVQAWYDIAAGSFVKLRVGGEAARWDLEAASNEAAGPRRRGGGARGRRLGREGRTGHRAVAGGVAGARRASRRSSASYDAQSARLVPRRLSDRRQ